MSLSTKWKYALVAGLATMLSGCDLAGDGELPMALHGPWIVQEIAGASLGEDVEIYLDIDAETGAISGFTGCNQFSASMVSFSNALAVGAIIEEPGDCPNAAAETDEARFLAVFPSVERFARRGKSLELLSRDPGEALLTLRVDDFASLSR